MLTSSPAGGWPHGSAESRSGLPASGSAGRGLRPSSASWLVCSPPSGTADSVLASEARLRNIYQILPEGRECVMPFPPSAPAKLRPASGLGTQRGDPLRGGGDPLVGGGQRDPDVPNPRGPVELAGGDQDAGLGGQPLGRRPAVARRVRGPQVQPGLGVVDGPAGPGQRRPQHGSPAGVTCPL